MDSWQCAHVYYYDSALQDALILDAVKPALRHAARAFFVRHWRQGPHLRVCAPASQLEAVVRPIACYLGENPSGVEVDEAAMLMAHERLAVRELERGPLRPLCPDNSIRYAPYDHRLHVLNTSEAAELIEDFYIATNGLVFDTLSAVRAGGSRLTMALDLMLGTAHAMWRDITRGFISYRAHAEGFIIQASQPERLRSSWDEHYRKQSAAITRRLRALLAGQPAFGHVDAWIEALHPFRKLALSLIDAGRLQLTAGGEAGRANGWRLENLAHSDFQNRLYTNVSYVDFLRNDPNLQCYRLMLNLLYLHLHRLGVGAVDRYYLCHLAAGAVEETFDVSALTLVSR